MYFQTVTLLFSFVTRCIRTISKHHVISKDPSECRHVSQDTSSYRRFVGNGDSTPVLTIEISYTTVADKHRIIMFTNMAFWQPFQFPAGVNRWKVLVLYDHDLMTTDDFIMLIPCKYTIYHFRPID